MTNLAEDYLNLDALLSADEIELRDKVRAFVRARISPNIKDWYGRAVFPREIVKEMGELGPLGMHLTGYGCPGRSAVEYGLTAMELEAGDSGLRTFVSVQGSLAMSAIHKFGSEAQKQRWLPGMASGELIGCFGLTEPTAGSDPASMQTRACKVDDGWVINGAKRWIGLASIAEIAVIWARTDDGIRGFLVPTDTAGFVATPIEPKLSMRASIQCDITLEDVRVPSDAMLPGATGLRGPFACLNEARRTASPTSCPCRFTTGPPELPGLSAASVCKYLIPLSSRKADTIPLVSVACPVSTLERGKPNTRTVLPTHTPDSRGDTGHIIISERNCVAPNFRTNPQAVRTLLARLLPNAPTRDAALRLMAASIALAERCRPGIFSITADTSLVNLNVGRLYVFRIMPGRVNVVGDGSQPAELDGLPPPQPWNGGIAPQFVTFTVPEAEIVDVLPRLAEMHAAAVEYAATTSTIAPYSHSHSPASTQVLREDFGLVAADPPVRVQGTAGTPLPSVHPRSLADALVSWDHSAARARAEKAEALRRQLVAEFPPEVWANLPLERYALGQGDSQQNFCYKMEFETRELGSIRGGSARKHLIFKYADKPGWFFDSRYGDEMAAWEAVRTGFVEAIGLAARGEYDSIDEIQAIKAAPALRTKMLFVLFPDAFLPIYASAHIDHFASLLGGSTEGLASTAANHVLRELVDGRRDFEGWSPFEVMYFLYHWADPRQARRIVKIAPGPDAMYWPECRDNGYICVGWEEMGDLAQYASPEEFETRFLDLHADQYVKAPGAGKGKARELWTLHDLEPGDIVVANRGKSHVLAVGTVVEPAYQWRGERPYYNHTVAVDWDGSVAQDIEPIQHWGTKTVTRVPDELYRRIMERALEEPPVYVGPDPLFLDIESDLGRRGQVVLYGPPGTGKTYNARRFGVWWLRKAWGNPDADWLLGDESAFANAERELTRVPGNGQATPLTRVTFHPSYGYEDFIEGFKPRKASTTAGLDLALTDGPFKRVCRAAAADSERRPYLIVIDEINRGNIPKILGELITLLERDKRGYTITLAQSGDEFAVPDNVFIVGTMNTADRSIRLLDAALRRRFAFIELLPDTTPLDGVTVEGSLALDLFLEQLNERIASRVGRERQVGQSFFLDKDGRPATSAREFAPRFLREVVPLLQEYAYDDFSVFAALVGESLVDAREQRLKRELREDPVALVNALAREFRGSEVSDDAATQ